jgi:signal transduction histidine kinase
VPPRTHRAPQPTRSDNAPVAGRKQIDLVLPEPPLALPEIVVDPEILGQILDNFVSNAIKFSPSGKRVFLSAGMMGNKIRLSVRDEGPGISPHEQQKLFQKFSKLSNRPTAGEPSTGLGLSIAKQFTELMGGTIDF